MARPMRLGYLQVVFAHQLDFDHLQTEKSMFSLTTLCDTILYGNTLGLGLVLVIFDISFTLCKHFGLTKIIFMKNVLCLNHY